MVLIGYDNFGINTHVGDLYFGVVFSSEDFEFMVQWRTWFENNLFRTNLVLALHLDIRGKLFI